MNQIKSVNSLRVIVVLVIVIALLVMQTGSANAQSQSNFTTVQRTAAATAALYGAGAGLCMAITAGGCGVPIVIGGVVMTGIATTLSFFPPPNDTVNWHNGSSADMPDAGYEDYSGGGGGNCGGGGDPVMGVLDPESMGGCE
jgi:hypothetical protein